MSMKNKTTYGISVMALYEQYGEKLSNCKIAKIEEGNETYYDLYNKNGVLACMDGESVTVINETNGTLTLSSVEDENNAVFTLTREEFSVASFSERGENEATLDNPETWLTLYGLPDDFEALKKATYNNSFGSVVTERGKMDVIIKANAKTEDVAHFVDVASRHNIDFNKPSALFLENYYVNAYYDLSPDKTYGIMVAESNNKFIIAETDRCGNFLSYVEDTYSGITPEFATVEKASEFCERYNLTVVNNPYKEHNFRIEPTNNGTFVVRSDSERFGVDEIVYESHNREDCIKYISERRAPLHDVKAYIIPDMIPMVTREDPMESIEHYDSVDDAIARFKHLCSTRDYSNGGINPHSQLPYSRLVIGVEGEDHQNPVDVIHVIDGKNTLIDDFSRRADINTETAFINAIEKICNTLRVEQVLKYEGRNKPMSLIQASEYKDDEFSCASSIFDMSVCIRPQIEKVELSQEEMFKGAGINRVQDEVEPEDIPDGIEAYNIYFNEDVVTELISRTSLLKDCEVSSVYELLTETDVTVYCIAEYKDNNLTLSLVRESDELDYKDYIIPLSDSEIACVNQNIEKFIGNEKNDVDKVKAHKQQDIKEQ